MGCRFTRRGTLLRAYQTMKVFKYLVAEQRRLRGMYPPGRNLLIFPDDVFLVTFPRSGNNWMRFLLANLLFPEQSVTLVDLHRLVPDLINGWKRDFDRLHRPRIIRSHECFDPRYPRVIYMVRDPRDVVISQHHYHRKLRKVEDDFPIEKFVDRFLAGETSSHASGSWGENIQTWLGTREGDPRFLFMRYEDMIADPQCGLRKTADFLGISPTAAEIATAVERSSADRMRKMEREQHDQWAFTKGSRKDLMWLRSAKAGGWRSELAPPLVAKIEAAWAPLMRHLGYELTTMDANTVERFTPLAMGGAVGSRA